ncbi:MAG TPA: DNA translocase FtsK 4TM domain-containing protein [Gemmatimonadaceae bacterium]
MPKKTRGNAVPAAEPEAEPSPEAIVADARRSHLKRELAGIALMLGAVFIAGALLAGGAADGQSCTTAGRIFGPVGSCLRSGILITLGALSAVVVPFIPAVHALRLLGRIPESEDRRLLFFTIGLAALIPLAAALAQGATLDASAVDPYAGLVGSFVAFYLVKAFGLGGAWVIIALGVSALMAGTLAWNPLRMLIGGSAKRAVAAEALPHAGDPAVIGTIATGADGLTRAEHLEPDSREMPVLDLALMAPAEAIAEQKELPLDDPVEKRSARKKKATKAERVAEHADAMAAAINAGTDPLDAMADELPPAELLSPGPARNIEQSRAHLDAMGQKLMDALRTFKVDGQLVGRTTGPTVTQYEIEPSPGVKVRQFANLANDLALAMRAASIRIVAPIPGKGAVGVEVPNPSAEIVAFREMIDSKDYQNTPRALPIALGRDLEGKAVIGDLAKMPHLLIAGATGSGKSVCVNTIITSLIYRHTPKTLRFLMVDPKMVELSVYNVLPHQRHKVVTDNRDAAALLKWAVIEMQDRYQLLAANGARNIQDFNQKVRDGAALVKPKDPDVAFEDRVYKAGVLPYIVVVIDELADLMMTCAAEVETPLAMLAQKARAIGVHLILATQRPSVNVITGLIKANFPSRIAFRVASQIDSRTILDGNGAESLLGNGDMLFIPPGKSEPSRIQGAYLSNDDTEALMKWYTDRREARKAAMEAQGLMHIEEMASEQDILEKVRAQEALEAGAGQGNEEEEGDRDKLFREAAEVCVQNQGGSTSLLQRRLKVGYGRAARIIDQLHLAGILGPPDGSKPRDVLVGLEDVARIAGDKTAA